LQGLQPTDVQVVVDATDKGAGTYQVRPRVPIVPEALRVQSIVPDTVLVTISEVKANITPTLPLSVTVPVLSIVSTPVITPTLLFTATIPTSLTLPTPTKMK
jgi:YbbR domain-containing protein